MQKNLQLFQKKLKIKFKNPKLLVKALTHKSYEPINNNEKILYLIFQCVEHERSTELGNR